MLRTAGRIAAAVGAVGSVALTLYAGRRNPSAPLMAAFVVWVSAPFVAYFVGAAWSTRWSAAARAALHGAMLVVAIGTLAIYGRVAAYPPARMAFTFLVVPPASWTVIAIAVSVAALTSRGPSSRV